jgi:hypothetical protein
MIERAAECDSLIYFLDKASKFRKYTIAKAVTMQVTFDKVYLGISAMPGKLAIRAHSWVIKDNCA